MFGIPAVFIIIIFLLLTGRLKKPILTKAPANIPGEVTQTSQPKAPEPLTLEQQSSFAMNQLAVQFAERFGSYSSQARGSNLQDLMPVMTARMQSWAKAQISNFQANLATVAYQGITTRAVSFETRSQSPTRADLVVKTQREERKNGEQKTYSQNLSLVVVKEGDSWKVDEATWLPVDNQ